MNLSGAPGSGGAGVDLRDPRIRVTFADVAMRIARDGPMYAVIVLVGVLTIRGTTTAAESIIGAAVALLARSHPPPEIDKSGRGMGTLGAVVFTLAAMGTAVVTCLL